MHPLAAIGLVFLTGLAWMVTVVTMLVSLAKAKGRAMPEAGSSPQHMQAHVADAEAAER